MADDGRLACWRTAPGSAGRRIFALRDVEALAAQRRDAAGAAK